MSCLPGEERESWSCTVGLPRPCYVSLRSTASGSRGYFDGSGGRAGKLGEHGLRFAFQVAQREGRDVREW